MQLQSSYQWTWLKKRHGQKRAHPKLTINSSLKEEKTRENSQPKQANRER